MNYGDGASTVGDVLAAAAILLATAQLRSAARAARQTQLDLREDRRLDFYLQQLVVVAEAIQKGVNVGFTGLELRTALLMLPPDLLPLLRASQEVHANDVGRAAYRTLLEEKPVPPHTAVLEHLQSDLQQEIEEARDHLLQIRPETPARAPWWQLWRV